jgi:hypothetical protein
MFNIMVDHAYDKYYGILFYLSRPQSIFVVDIMECPTGFCLKLFYTKNIMESFFKVLETFRLYHD